MSWPQSMGPSLLEYRAMTSLSGDAEIPREPYFCNLCQDHPQGFHGDHELRRHIDRRHANLRQVWRCKDNSVNSKAKIVVPIKNCKPCRTNKTYGSNYAAAAHLRRVHFNPRKNKRGSRGGMGGDELLPMEELKNWMYEETSTIVNDDIVFQDPVFGNLYTV